MTAEIFDIKKFAVHDGDGIRTTVFFKGCPLRCVWCHNPEGLSAAHQLALIRHKCTLCGRCADVCPQGAHQITKDTHTLDRTACTSCGRCADACPQDALRLYGRRAEVGELMPILLADRDFYEDSGGGVTLSGGECLLQAPFCADLLARLKAEGIRTAVDTCGAVPWESMEAVLPYTDVFLYDVKAITDDVHRRCTGRGNAQILANLRRLDTAGAKIEVRIPYVPDFNDGELPAIAQLLASLRNLTKVRLLAYHSYAADRYASLDMPHTLPARIPTAEEMRAGRELLRSTGLRVAE